MGCDGGGYGAPSGRGYGGDGDPGQRRFAPYPGLSYVVPSAHLGITLELITYPQ